MSSLDPARHWLAAGITGIARGREWDAIGAVEAPGTPGEEVEFVALADGRLLATSGSGDLETFAGALAGAIDPPYRAVAVKQPELWAVGARSIDVVELADDPGGDSVELVRTDEGTAARIDDVPTTRLLPELERLGEARGDAYVVRAARIDRRLFEIEVEAL